MNVLSGELVCYHSSGPILQDYTAQNVALCWTDASSWGLGMALLRLLVHCCFNERTCYECPEGVSSPK